jgi:antitoxin YefM
MSTQQVTFQECNTQFAKIFERVLQNHEVISVYKEPEKSIVILDEREYSRERLYQSISQHEQGQVREIDVKAYLD